MNDKTEFQLVETARGGDVESFGELYQRHYAGMVGVAYSVLSDRHLAEDAAQETFAIACRDLSRLKRSEKFAGWLRGICRNVAKDIVHSRAKRKTAVDPPARDEDSSGDGRDEAVRLAVSRLRPPAREVVLRNRA